MKGILFMTDVQEPSRERGIALASSGNIRDYATPGDLEVAARHWEARLAANPKLFDSVLGNVMDNRGERHVIPSNFSIYEAFAMAYPGKPNPYSSGLTNALRSSAVTCSLDTSDGFVITQKIQPGIVCGGMIDPTAGGMVPANEQGIINPYERMLKRVKGESQIVPEAVRDLRYTGAHLAMDIRTFTDTYAGTTPLTRAQVERQFQGKESAELFFVPRENLPKYIIDHSVGDAELRSVDDATATLLATLEKPEFEETVDRMRHAGGDIRFGNFVDGKFIEIV